MKFNLKELVDVAKLQELTDHLYEAAGIPSSIIAMDGEILTGSGWQRICTDFHRKHPQIEKDCIASDVAIRKKLDEGEPFCMYTCPRGLTDASIPIVIEGEHLANAFAGQIFLEPPDEAVERRFREQARLFGLDEAAYMEAFRKIPVMPPERFRSALLFLAKLAQIIAESGLQRKRELETHEQLRESEQRFRAIFDHTIDGILLADVENKKFVLGNKKIHEMLGYSQEEIDELGVLDIHPREAIPHVVEQFEKQARKEIAVAADLPVKRKDGTIFYADIDSSPVVLRDRKILIGVFRDITERKRAEEALKASEAFLDSIIENSPHAMWISDSQGVLIRLNQACRDLLRVTDDEVVGKYNILQDSIVIEQGHLPLVKKVFEEGTTVRFTISYDSARLEAIALKKHTSIVLDVTISPVLDLNGKVIHAIIQHVDITERKRAEEALRQSEKNLAEAQRQTHIGSFEYDFAKGRLRWSEEMFRITGIKAEDFHGTQADFLSRVHPEDLPRVAKLREQGLDPRGGPLETEFRILRPDGTERFVRMLFETAFDAKGNPLRRIGTFQDVTDRKREEKEKQRLEAQLQQAMKMEAVGRLAGGVAHDFNNLLTGIMGNLQLAQMEMKPDDPLAEMLTEVNKAAESAAALTRQLLAFSRKQLIEPKVLDLNDIISSLHKMLARLIGEDIELKTVPGKSLGAVKVDPGQIEQILVNLAINARDAMPDGGTLLVETGDVELDEEYCRRHSNAQPGGFVMLAVSDTGVGMSEEVKSHLFEPFFTTKPKGHGTGLGLATIYGAVKQSGGFVEVYSEPGMGTSFKIYLPRAMEKAEKLEKGRRVLEMPGGTETVLLVEDEGIVRELAIKILKRLGYKVLHAPNGGEAFMMAEGYKNRIDLLLTDVVMPGMNGRQLAERLVEIHPEMKVLYTSGYTENVIVHHGVVEENLNFIGKPYAPRDLAAKLREVLESDGK